MRPRLHPQRCRLRSKVIRCLARGAACIVEEETDLQTRLVQGTVAFARPIFFTRMDRELPAGSYDIETDEELLEGGTTLSYRRTEIRLLVPRVDGASEAQLWI